MLNVWRAIALEAYYNTWKRTTWPATRSRFTHVVNLRTLHALWYSLQKFNKNPY